MATSLGQEAIEDFDYQLQLILFDPLASTWLGIKEALDNKTFTTLANSIVLQGTKVCEESFAALGHLKFDHVSPPLENQNLLSSPKQQENNSGIKHFNFSNSELLKLKSADAEFRNQLCLMVISSKH
ncbi:hypothetical protein ZIOFF_021258 [Zingiber officinale]|uniref:Uncharacterized protein n=1 Tax=Zingiber officinale TaxID=94328 RepID=A0A8J5H6M9_ZINOF|nr:hypothetical protein ZIOFF_021258 [Zingiber officinale]